MLVCSSVLAHCCAVWFVTEERRKIDGFSSGIILVVFIVKAFIHAKTTLLFYFITENRQVQSLSNLASNIPRQSPEPDSPIRLCRRDVAVYYSVIHHIVCLLLCIINNGVYWRHCPIVTQCHGRRSREDRGTSLPEFGAGGLSPKILSCYKILSTRLLALQYRKMYFCLYSRTFIVSLAMRPPEFQSDLYAYAQCH